MGIEQTMSNILYDISDLKEHGNESAYKAILANLRNSIGKPYSQTVEVWSFMFEHIPEEFLGKGTELTNMEKSILSTLQLYALHQQGKSENVHEHYKEPWKNMGFSLSLLRLDANKRQAADHRFNTMITSTTYYEFIHHLRQMTGLIKRENATVDYVKLAMDLYIFAKGDAEKVRLRWGKSYYGTKIK